MRINQKCVLCGACRDNCPVEAIKLVSGKMLIDKDLCVECGTCIEVCPVGAIDDEYEFDCECETCCDDECSCGCECEACCDIQTDYANEFSKDYQSEELK